MHRLRNLLLTALLIFTSLGSGPAVRAEPIQRWGLGAFLGEPVGVSAKFWIAERWAADFGLGYSWLSQARVWTDTLYHLPIRLASQEVSLNLIFGLGVRFFFAAGPFVATGVGSGIGVGARIPLGVETCFTAGPFCTGVFFSPGIGVLPHWAFAPEGALTLRVILKSH